MQKYLLLCLCGLVMLAGCSGKPPKPPHEACGSELKPAIHGTVGKRCVVQFRRDALGIVTPLPIGPVQTGDVNADLGIAGTLTKTSADWIVVSNDLGEFVIPLDAILSLRFDPPAAKK